MNKRYDEWLQSLTDEDRDQRVIVEAYFSTRSPLPGMSATGNELLPDHKSTQDIFDDLYAMMSVKTWLISKYLILNGYTPMTDSDGTLKWGIWRDVRFSGLL